MNRGTIARRGSLAAGAAAVALMLGACSSGGAQTGGESSQGTVAVTVGAVYTTAAVPLWIAEEQGYFEENGLDVTINQSPNFAASAPSLLNGQMQFANAATAPVLTAIGQNMPLTIVAGVSAEQDDPSKGDDQVVVGEGSTITRPKDLEGKTIAASAIGSGPYVGVMANYIEDGGDPSKIKWIVMNLNEMIPALEKGQIDAAVLSEPFTANALSSGYTAAFNAYRVDGIDLLPAGFTDAVLVASTDYAAKNPDVVGRMQKAMIEANDYAAANPDAVRQLLVSKLDIDEAVAANVNLPAWVGEVSPDAIQSMITAMTDVGLLKTDIEAADIIWKP